MPECPSLRQLDLGAEPGAWTALGFAVARDRCRIGDVELAFTDRVGGIRGWSLGAGAGIADRPERVDGLVTAWPDGPDPEPGGGVGIHANGVVAIDHVVVITDSLVRTTDALAGVGLAVRRIREAGEGRRQAFVWLGDRQLVLEVVEAPGQPLDHAAFWGLTVVVDDLDAAAGRLGGALGAIRPAVQPGRRIATVRREAGLGLPVALITPHVPRRDTP